MLDEELKQKIGEPSSSCSWLRVRESRRLLALRLFQSRTVAELGLHYQQCNLLSLFTLGYAPGCCTCVWLLLR
ncbi:hypothetical protein Taro_044713 [Colocasia esculenta]|uniref:Uncharacterized protein n=1 Tax=Colocasia esculenta TaxID=4460 RepID=A0A843WJZ2_COLES|nr:hypothetical protein [Colocasia esculenta]